MINSETEINRINSAENMVYLFCMGMFNSSQVSIQAIDKAKRKIISSSNDTVHKQINTLNKKFGDDLGSMVGLNVLLHLKKQFI